jgi:hypothetical protein
MMHIFFILFIILFFTEKIEKRPADHLFWSPRGSFIVLAGFGALGGVRTSN